MNEVLIFSQNAVITDGWPDIYYNNYRGNKWEATINVNNLRFDVTECDSSDEAVARIEQALVENFGFFDSRKNVKPRRTTFGRRKDDDQFSWPPT